MKGQQEHIDRQATEVARHALGSESVVTTFGNAQWRIKNTPLGELDVVGLASGHCLVSMRSERNQPAPFRAGKLPLSPKLKAYLKRNDLTPIQIIRGNDIGDVITQIADTKTRGDVEDSRLRDSGSVQPWSPCVIRHTPLPDGFRLLGDDPQRNAVRLEILLETQDRSDDVSAIPFLFSATTGIGRLTIARVAAQMLGASCFEIPLARVLAVERMFSSPAEALLEELLLSQAAVSGAHIPLVIVLSDAELLLKSGPASRPRELYYLVHELSRIGALVLTARGAENEWDMPFPFFPIACRGFGRKDASAFLRDVIGSQLAKGLEDTLLSLAKDGEFYVASRLRYLARIVLLTRSRVPTADRGTMLYPDDISLAKSITQIAWGKRRGTKQ